MRELCPRFPSMARFKWAVLIDVSRGRVGDIIGRRLVFRLALLAFGAGAL